ncbi:Vps5 C terminal like-domain-containing protein [Spinellus fusiger]|nr:Vps5 C terminal like-domain-containing protein [Spinellus fusiger]
MNNYGSDHHLGFGHSLEENPFADVVSQNNASVSTDTAQQNSPSPLSYTFPIEQDISIPSWETEPEITVPSQTTTLEPSHESSMVTQITEPEAVPQPKVQPQLEPDIPVQVEIPVQKVQTEAEISLHAEILPQAQPQSRSETETETETKSQDMESETTVENTDRQAVTEVEEWDDQPSEEENDDEDTSSENRDLHQTKTEDELDTQSESLEIPKSGIRPFFEVTVEDPQKVGDAINAHIVYKVKTKTNSPFFRSSECVVARRYRDFLWLYNQLALGNPGVIVPPVPEKHALGRFQDEFVESRRIALERCLRKIVSHPMLYGDPDLKVFLESEAFNTEKRQKRAEPEAPKLGFMRSFGETISNAASNPFSKFVEVDEWFTSKKNQLDVLETQLKALMKSVESVVKQRKELGIATSDFGESMFPLASAELNQNLSTHLRVLGDIQRQMKVLHEQQARHDILTLEHTIDEYVRIIGSIRLSFNARIKAYQVFQAGEYELQKKITAFEKLKGQAKNKTDKMAAAQQEIVEMRQRVNEHRKEFEEISKLIKSELDRFDREKVEDFRDSVEQFLCSMIEYQKQMIALWEMFFEKTEGLEDEEYENESDEED